MRGYSYRDIAPPGRWVRQAACGGAGDAMFPSTGEGARRVIERYCNRCPVVVDCHVYAFRTRPKSGVWGGLFYGATW